MGDEGNLVQIKSDKTKKVFNSKLRVNNSYQNKNRYKKTVDKNLQIYKVGVKVLAPSSLTFSSSLREQKRPKDLPKNHYLGDVSLSLNMTVVYI